VLCDDENIARHIIATGVDITEQKKAEQALRQGEERFKRFSEISIDGIVIHNKGKILDANITLAKMLGYELPELIGMDGSKMVVPEDQKRMMDNILSDYKKPYEVVCIRKDGTRFPVEIHSRTFDYQGLTCRVGSIRDITERKQAENALRQNEERYRTIIEHANDMIWAVDAGGNFIFGNHQIEMATGHKVEEWVGKPYAPIVHPDDLPMVNEIHKKILSGESQQYTLRIYNKNKAPMVLAISATPFRENDKIIGSVNFGRDITARKLMEDALHQSEKRYRTLAEAANDMIYIVDYNGVVQYANNFAANILNSRAPEIIGKQLGELFPKESSERFLSNIRKVFDTGEPLYVRAQTRFTSKEIWLGTWLAPIKGASRTINSVMGISRDITAQKHTEDVLLESEEKHRTLIENIQDGVFVIQDAKLQFTNEAFARTVGYTVDEVMGMDFRKLVAPEDLELVTERYFKRQAGTPVPREYEFRALHKNGQTRIAVNMTVGLINYRGKVASMGTIKDVTERKRVEEKLQQSFNRLHKTLEGTVNTLSSIAEKRDPYTAGHQQMVTKLAMAIAKEMNLPEERVRCIRVAALLHDIGKLSIPAEILAKPGQMTETEMSLIKVHAQAGYDILKTIEFQWPIAAIVLQHHERLDGSGYPNGLAGDKICLEARIIGVADVVESIASHRPYRPLIGIDKALEEISKHKDSFYDPAVVDACVRLFKEKGFKLE
jgi:PAS domain S-box-containing protein/putative nucleotidyltransferase with HDIG domain